MTIELLDPDARAVRALLAASDAYMAALYPAESNHMTSAESLKQPNVRFVGCSIGELVVACGAVMVMADQPRYGEIKRVFVAESQRGRGLSRQVMQHLEAQLLAGGINWARLETGIHQPQAINLYRKLGYVERAPFGAYAADPLSIFMEKRLA